MAELTTNDIKDFLSQLQGKEISLQDIRKEFNILPNTKSFDAVRNIMFRLTEQKVVRPSGKHSGTYKIITQVAPVSIFSVDRPITEPFPLIFPRDFDTGQEWDFVNDVVIREGDMILASGLSNFGKTAVCLNFLGENITSKPVLMGNEYTTLVDGEYIPTPRFLSRLRAMDWVDWVDVDGCDKFTLLPVRDDYAEHIVADKINIIDWINIDSGEHYMIGSILEGIKRQLGRGIAIVAIQKAEGATAGRGGQFTRDFADLELLIDRFGDSDVLLTIGKVKEANRNIVGKNYSYSIGKGVKLFNFREVKKCPACHGTGYNKSGKCETCQGNKFINA